MIRPRSLVEVVAWICVPLTVTGSKCSGERQKLMVSSLVFSRFAGINFPLTSWKLGLLLLVRYFVARLVLFLTRWVSSTYFHISKSALGVRRSLIMSKKSQGPNLVPWGTPADTGPHKLKQDRNNGNNLLIPGPRRNCKQ